ncbi:MAG: PD-(D/E)XK nuclease family protein [Prevotella sp.]|nr:PD-(D/E)XK nuclease family protein [Prevotella sp.]
MKDFLAYVADDMLSKYGNNLSRVAVVFPNKRASLFLNEHLARLAQKPIWSPACITISELFRQQSDYQVADPIKLVCDLHKSFCLCTGLQETLDKFYGWGQLLLTDFDDIDKNMADADLVFANLRDIHELDDISYLTDEQREMIQRFFSNFSEQHNTELKERFLRLWSHFADIYHDYNRRLANQQLTYEGALYRQVVSSHLSSLTSHLAPYDHYLFVGFNLLQKVELQLFSELQKAGKAHFYWDFDHYYMKRHEAGQYIGRYLQQFPNELDIESTDIYGNFSKQKHITYISAPTEDIQARYVSTWLRENQRLKDGRRTAIVLCNENLLQTVIHCLPDEIDKVNVTTGYPLSQTPVASLINIWFDLQLLGRTPRMLRILQRHPYAKYISDDQLPLLQILREVATNGKEDISDPLFQESLFRAYTLVNRIENLRQSGDLTVDLATLQRLTSQIIQQTSIPFHGEPAEGIQVMGVLETRNLDFDHVLLLSCNEGNIPRGVNDSSFIPHNIRQAYELTTIDNKVTIYAYYFHRLLQRASDVTILYNNSTEDGQRGEMSRFMLQLMVESPHTITRRILQSGQSVQKWQPAPIEKTPHVMQVLQSQFTTQHSFLSPTAITRYMRCPLQFYYLYVADIQQPDTPDDEQELDNRIFGTVFHEAADIIYHQLPKYIEKPLLEHLLKSKVEIERAVDEAFHRVIPYAPKRGLHLINREVIIHYLRQLISIDLRLAPFTILGLECDVFRPLSPLTSHFSPLTIGGRIDRLDLITEGNEELIRVVDYKTGSKSPKPLPDVEAIFLPENIHEHADYYLQTFVYADIVSRQRPDHKVSPALLFIQHAGGKDYNPTLTLGREPVRDIAPYSTRFNELLDEKIMEMFSPDVPFIPTDDLRICDTCPFKQMCRR